MSDDKKVVEKPKRESPSASFTEVPTDEVSLESLYEYRDGAEGDIAAEQLIDTAHSDGHTFNPHHAQDQGLTYTPPTDPPVLPSDDPQGARIAAGFAPSMEDTDPNARRVPGRIDGEDLDLEEDARSALRNNSESSHLDNVVIQVENGVATLEGTVFSEDDLGIVDRIVANIDGINRVESYLTIQPRK